jgi:circadian clock protein KaiB
MHEDVIGQGAGDLAAAFEHAAADRSSQHYVLRLYVTGNTPKSIRAINNLKAICEEFLDGRFELEVIDLYQQPHLAKGSHIVAAPTLVKHLPEPVRRIIGDLSDRQKVLVGLGLQTHLTQATGRLESNGQE